MARRVHFGEYSALHDILSEMHALLIKHDSGMQSATFNAIRAVESLDREAIDNSLNTLEFWGGMGSILDLILFEIPWTPEFRRDVVDDNRKTLLELNLIDEMENLGIAKAGVLARRADVQWIAKSYGLLPS